MLLKRKLQFAALLLLIIAGCKEDVKVPEKTLNEKLGFNETNYKTELENLFNDESFKPYLRDSSFQYLDTLKTFYSARSYKPFFIKSFESKDFVDSLLIVLDDVERHGIDKELYHYNLIASEFYNSVNDTIQNNERLKQLAASELFIGDAVLKYSYHMRYGMVNPKKLFPQSYALPVVDSSKREIFQPLKQKDIIKYLYDIQPKNEKYTRLQTKLKFFNDLKNDNWEQIILSKNKLVEGNKDSSLIAIANRLIALGFLDTAKTQIKDFTLYDSSLVRSIKYFQRLNGLNDDGVIGKGTIDRLNTTPDEYITKIKVNLERFRWFDYSDTSKYVLVNIPDFKLYVIENRKEMFDIKVCTGSKRSAGYQKKLAIYKKTKKYYDKPEDWETPCVYAEISYMVLNPTWTVPASIIREEIVREVKKDSTYLFAKNFKVFQDGIELNLDEVNTKEFSAEKIPYTIVQDPGPGNALGKIKFMFKNPFGIYLHDTPTRVPFSYSNRAVSHGCVRVEKPLQFSEYLLKDHSKWNTDFLKIEIGQKPDDKSSIAEYQKKRKELRKDRSYGKTTEIILDKKIPLFIDYYTAWVDDNGEINFREDVYNKDKILKDYLFPEHKLEKLISYVK